jgi:hypothetical protein
LTQLLFTLLFLLVFCFMQWCVFCGWHLGYMCFGGQCVCEWLIIVFGWLHRVELSGLTDISEAHAASTFTVEMWSSKGPLLCIFRPRQSTNLPTLPLNVGFQNRVLYIHINSSTSHTLTLKMEKVCVSETSTTSPTSTRCKNARTELASTYLKAWQFYECSSRQRLYRNVLAILELINFIHNAFMCHVRHL